METIYIGDDIVTAETKVLFDRQDFVDLVHEKLGNEAGTYLRDFLEDMYQEGYSQDMTMAMKLVMTPDIILAVMIKWQFDEE